MASKKTIWNLSLEISGKGTEASQAIRTVKKQLEDLKGAADQLGKDWKSFTGNATKLALGVAGGVTAATAGVVAMANSFAETGDKVAKTSAAIGIGIEAYQGLQHAMGQSGVSAEEFDSALKKFNIKRGSLRFLVSTNGRYYDRVNPEYEKVIEALREEIGGKYLRLWNPKL
jgi:hypothetical protein